MLTYQIVEGATAGKNAQTFIPTEEGKAMAHVPGWLMLLDPDYVLQNGVQNRCIKDGVAEYAAGTHVNIGKFKSGQNAFNPTNSNQLRLNPNIDFPRDAWSLVFVAKPDVKTPPDLNTIITSNTYKTGVIKVGVAFPSSASTLRIMENGGITDGKTRLTYTPVESNRLSEGEAVYIVTGSSKNGLSIYKNGVLVASNQNKDLISEEWRAGDWHVLRGARGLFGMIGLLSIDLNDPANHSFRNQINGFLMNKYEISA